MKEVRTRTDFEELTEKIKECIAWFDRAYFEEKEYHVNLANGKKIKVLFTKNSIAHLLGIDTDYLKNASIYPKQKSSYEILKEMCKNPYRITSLVSSGNLSYKNFVSDYAFV